MWAKAHTERGGGQFGIAPPTFGADEHRGGGQREGLATRDRQRQAGAAATAGPAIAAAARPANASAGAAATTSANATGPSTAGTHARRLCIAAWRATSRRRSSWRPALAGAQRTMQRSVVITTTRSTPASVSFWTAHSGCSPLVRAKATVRAGAGRGLPDDVADG